MGMSPGSERKAFGLSVYMILTVMMSNDFFSMICMTGFVWISLADRPLMC